MKNSAFYLSFMALPLLFSCNQNAQKNQELKDSLNAVSKGLAPKECYMAIDGKDTATLVIRPILNDKLSGHLLINYETKGKNDGEFEGAYKGDTLFVDYTFQIGTTNKTVYKNPLAFLKKDGKLILGVGQIETNVGKSYFVKGKPINFDKGRFTFAPTDCKEEKL
ncbi:MAG: hypothetical protein P0Y49_18935 [Candidatus Pedobacter colombiensis]|uniref:Lipoprotein n=1 Tax=Candidatus Pedobacter colombiensis TaxID=3121371 RepID=A0AAJ6B649_9SPHI|nr:hypothetical protein [Pedobacter sp.]WEK18855.1 MAG: hypothetical protein P0Y49_18935 [Pedobacter sp.]